MYQAVLFEDIPTEVIPGISPPLAPIIGPPQTTLNISLSHIDRCRSVIEDVDTLAALRLCRHTLDVLGVSGPHFTAVFHQRHFASLADSGNHDHRLCGLPSIEAIQITEAILFALVHVP